MNELNGLRERLYNELREISRKGELTAGNLETVDKLTHALKNLDKIMDSDYSGRYYDARDNGRIMRGYSRSSGEMARKLHDLAADCPSEETRREMERLADKIERMP